MSILKDPAGPYFENTPAEVRLDKTDAVYVDNIHTMAYKFASVFSVGTMQALGHVDFYPNGGTKQPGLYQCFTKPIRDKTN